METKLFLLCCIFALCACNKTKTAPENVLTIVVDDAHKKEIKEIISDWNVIELEYKDEALLADISDMAIANNRIYCYTQDQDGYVVAFDLNGKYLFKIQHRGHANNEWVKLNAFFINEKEGCMLLTDYAGRKVLKYDLDGKFICTYPVLGNNDCYEVAMSNGLLYSVSSLIFSGGAITNQNEYKVSIYKEDGSVVRRSVETRFDDTGVMQTRSFNNLTMSYDGSFFYTPYLDEYIYTIKGDSVLPYLKFDYKGSKKLITQEDIEKYKDSNKNKPYIAALGGINGQTYYSGEFIETPDYIYRQMGMTEAFSVWYDKKSKQAYTIQFDAPFLLGQTLSKLMLYPSPYTYYKDRFYAPFQTQLLSFPDEFIKEDMPDELKPYWKKQKEGKLNALIFTYKIKL